MLLGRLAATVAWRLILATLGGAVLGSLARGVPRAHHITLPLGTPGQAALAIAVAAMGVFSSMVSLS